MGFEIDLIAASCAEKRSAKRQMPVSRSNGTSRWKLRVCQRPISKTSASAGRSFPEGRRAAGEKRFGG